MFANVGYVAALGPAGVAGSNRVAAEAVGQAAGPWAAKLVAAAILVSVFSAMNGLTITAPRMYYAMAQDGLFFKALARVHPRFGTPALAVVAGSIWAALLALTGTFESLLTYVVFVGWIFYGLGAACVLVLRAKLPNAERPFRVPGYPWTPWVFVLAAMGLVVNTLVTQPVRSAIGIGGVLVGVPIYLWSAARNSLGHGRCSACESTQVSRLLGRSRSRACREPNPQLMDVGGHRLDVLRAGSGGPAIVFEAGLGDDLEDWARIWPAVAEFSTVVVYSRSGLGRSEPGIGRPLGRAEMTELHALLGKLQLKPRTYWSDAPTVVCWSGSTRRSIRPMWRAWCWSMGPTNSRCSDGGCSTAPIRAPSVLSTTPS